VSSDHGHVQLSGKAIPVVRLTAGSSAAVVAAALTAAGLPVRAPVVVLVGGAGGLGPAGARTCSVLFERALLPVIEDIGAVLVDGGTDAGIMSLAAQARRRIGGRSPHVGVVAEGTVRWPGSVREASDPADLEPHHTHFVVVPGDQWGDEAPWLSVVASAIAGPAPSVTVLANGGNIAYDDVRISLDTHRPVLVLGGTGRTADAITVAHEGSLADLRARELAASDLLRVVHDDPNALRAALATALAV
jgi:SLOG in TRPM, prokaryote